ncbi:MAG: hypothetical protein P4L69_05225, partial [Desulfosporosinus sp.]|nr:hypothetical protein [Desulfosporosinus sp.]
SCNFEHLIQCLPNSTGFPPSTLFTSAMNFEKCIFTQMFFSPFAKSTWTNRYSNCTISGGINAAAISDGSFYQCSIVFDGCTITPGPSYTIQILNNDGVIKFVNCTFPALAGAGNAFNMYMYGDATHLLTASSFLTTTVVFDNCVFAPAAGSYGLSITSNAPGTVTPFARFVVTNCRFQTGKAINNANVSNLSVSECTMDDGTITNAASCNTYVTNCKVTANFDATKHFGLKDDGTVVGTNLIVRGSETIYNTSDASKSVALVTDTSGNLGITPVGPGIKLYYATDPAQVTTIDTLSNGVLTITPSGRHTYFYSDEFVFSADNSKYIQINVDNNGYGTLATIGGAAYLSTNSGTTFNVAKTTDASAVGTAAMTVQGGLSIAHKTHAGDSITIHNQTDTSKLNVLQTENPTGNLLITSAAQVKLVTPMWDELCLLSSARVAPPPATTAPDITTLGNTILGYPIQMYVFPHGATKTIQFMGQLPHNWKINTQIIPHAHLAVTTAPSLDANFVLSWFITNSDGGSISPYDSYEETKARTLTGLGSGSVFTLAFTAQTPSAITGASALIFGQFTRTGLDAADTSSDQVWLAGLDFFIQKDAINGTTTAVY